NDTSGLLVGQRLLITAGPTREQSDPVRFFSNRSTGKMGYAFAEEAAKMGARVTLIAGPTSLDDPAGVDVIHVQSAEDMYQAALSVFDESDIVIKTAAVADYRPKHIYDQKMKKKDGGLVIELERTKDILKALGERKTKQVLVGFAAETQHVEDYAKQKLEKKNLDLIVANNITAEGAGFGTETNIVTVFHRDGKKTAHPLMSKREVAAEVLKEAAELAGRSGTSS
ncbi:bifunctional phosphopantothenoylcysteine decarboxylase/phosphopantothenate--cysteine ligase CoaBC, partial [Bacillus sp. MBGLi79]|uniref:bifunctional phosphopantothenoylcysteine decarboxylase/phosphopantothenate--cysteine ligase CoaBC n=1 Tax=Bacillus sp. MBGLi79 TaxID=2070759 RepID=UPI000CDC4071